MKRLVLLLTAASLTLFAAATAMPGERVARAAVASAAPAPSAQAAAPQPATSWYFAEGYTGGTFTTYLTLANPNAALAHVTVRYLLGGSAPLTRSYTITPYLRATINVNNVIGANQNVSLAVTADQPIVAERPIYFTYPLRSGGSAPGGSDVLGATSLGQTFQFAYLDTSVGHETWLTILNPNAAPLTVTARYLAANGTSSTRSYTVGANRRGTIYVNNEVPAGPGTYSAVITLSAPGLVERPLYARDGETGYTGGASVLGVPAAQTDWYFAEGWVAPTSVERYVLANPAATTATARLTLYRPAPTPPTAVTVTLAPGQQQILSVSSLLGVNAGNNSAWVHATSGTLLAERVMSIRYSGLVGSGSTETIPSLTDVPGTTTPGKWFYFAEGYAGGAFAEYLTIANPDPSRMAKVLVSFLPQGAGTPTVRVYYVQPSARFTLYANSVMAGQSFSMVVQSDILIVAERPMYFVYPGPSGSQTGASDIVGYQPPETAPDPPLSSCTPAPGVMRVSSDVIYSGTTSRKQIALTFDAGGDAAPSAAILDILRNHGLHVTIFVTGQWQQANPTLVQRIYNEGHQIANHSFDHPSMPALTDSAICQQLNQTEQILSTATQQTTRPFFRPPYGDIGTDQSGHTVQSVAAGLGYRTVMWNVDTIDWDPNTTTTYAYNKVMNNLAPGELVLMHLGSVVELRDYNGMRLLDRIITDVEARGYSIVMLSTLIQ